VEFHSALSRLAVAVQVRGRSKHAGVSYRAFSGLASRSPPPTASRICFVLARAIVCSFTLVLDWLVVRPQAQRRQGQQFPSWKMDIASGLLRPVCGCVIASAIRGRLCELSLFRNCSLAFSPYRNGRVEGLAQPRYVTSMFHQLLPPGAPPGLECCEPVRLERFPARPANPSLLQFFKYLNVHISRLQK
jgi:hypothetical protein